MSSEINHNIEYSDRTNPGLKEEYNFDHTGSFETTNGYIFIVCGGVKEKAGAAIASKIAVKSIGEYFKNKKYRNPQKALYNAVIFANQQVFEQADKNSKLKGMATTLVVVLVNNNQAYYAYVGNSRLYLLIDNKLQQLTKDHVEGDKIINMLGLSKDLKFSICKNPIYLNDENQLLLTSDGITNQLSDDEIYKALSEEDISIEHKTAKLIDRANAKGGNDNVSAIFMRYDTKIPKKKSVIEKRTVNPLFYIIPLAVVLLGVGIYFFVANDLHKKSIAFLKDKFTKKEIVAQEEKMDDSTAVIDSALMLDSLEIAGDIILRDTVISYRILKNENMYRIGLHFNIPAETIAAFNNIKKTSISVGQKIHIPVKGTYIVKEDDLIYQIAQKMKVDYKSIIDANHLDTYEYLVAGSELYIPYQKGEYQRN